MEYDKEKMESLVSKVKEKFGKKVEIVNLKLDVKMPLFEIFLQASIHTQIKIFYARGRTLQYRLPPVFWTRCKILKENKILQEKYGGECAPGLFPQYDEYNIMQIMTECVYNDKYNFYVYDVNLEWENLCALTPENRELRKIVHQNVHVPTRLAVIKAFEQGKKINNIYILYNNFDYIIWPLFGIFLYYTYTMLIFLKYVDRKFLISIVLFFCSHTFVENYNIHKKRKTFILPPRLKKSFSYKPNKVINTFEIGLKADEELDDYKYFTEEE
ncbi:hypothetical protein C923_02986 [Plasmodium falciparum UGT5.1]|uniref:Uncharacterized protein n=1 Tax=Plasmodium falciparum UGT5.1 TaxID=1237627 RepID=W7JBS1_PLAFA|nr:hypothetical protein C923_02986 [Plasmodium falciparum UGT5.1]